MMIIILGTGYYLYITKHDQPIMAARISRNISFNGDKCLDFWYNMDHKSTIRIYIPGDASEDLAIISVPQKNSRTWQHAYVNLIHALPYEIAIEGIIGTTADPYIAIDDTDIQDWPCNGKNS